MIRSSEVGQSSYPPRIPGMMNPLQSIPPSLRSGTQEMGMASPAPNSASIIHDVWSWNLSENMASLRQLVGRYKFISIDCKFPGIIARPIGSFKSTSEYHYQTLRSNVDILEVIQIGLTLADEFGGQAGTWQFNFRFNLESDTFSADGVEMLRQAGVDFSKHATEGIDVFKFAELMISSGLILNDEVSWITFHSGYDLGYILSVLVNRELPVLEKDFLKLLNIYFHSIWDVKYIVKTFKVTDKSSLFEVSQELLMRKNNFLNQAGGDSLLSILCFFELFKMIGSQNLNQSKNKLFGLDSEFLEDEDDDTKEGTSVNNAVSVFQFGKMGGGA